MKLTRLHIYIAVAASLALGSTSCSILNNSHTTKISGSEGKRDASTGKPSKKLIPPTDAQKNSGKKDKKKPSDRPSPSASRELLTDSNDSTVSRAADSLPHSLPADFSISGEWTIASVRNNILNDEERPYINFDLNQKRFYGSNGCNVINGDLLLTPPDSIRMDNMIATMRLCQDAPYEYLINLAISDVRTFLPRQEGNVTFLDLKDGSGQTVMVVRRHNMDFLNGAWKVELLNGTKPNEEQQPTLTINTTDLQLHGTSGCNIINGRAFIDPDKFDSLQFIDIATTRKGCPPESRETEFLLALESVETAKETAPGTVTLYDTEGNELFVLSRIECRK